MKRRIYAAQKKFVDYNTRICHDCKEPNWTPAQKSVFKMKHNQPRFCNQQKKPVVPIPKEQSSYHFDDNMDTDNESEEQNVTFAAMHHIKDCEYQYLLNEPRRNLLKKNLLLCLLLL
ncbi:hypothetical protein HMPREF1544_04960 [Mucor circinelloides 1006PhL]|uniref:Uncharacterized protein n=1 Tax=Mucor circinelloides f. circinelloides (strain 1006PhL) TaxID=1220926 RepID=S2JIB8_MUCC1|nr:hypothetical protein HMPREF1544_04960 [Mucor circinelloides 1006PhL]